MIDFNIEYLRKFTDDNTDYHLDSWDCHEVELPFKILPRDFLTFAEFDLASEYDHHLINSLSNTKRAIECQLDCLLYGFGLFERSKNQHWNFPNKVECMNNIGIISPRILQKINKKRNLLEHEYVLPQKEETEDALDVANLFVAYTERYVSNALLDCEPSNDTMSVVFRVKLDYKNNRMLFSGSEFRDGKSVEISKEVVADSDKYVDYLKWFISLYKLI
jgi:hypothetical protein